MRADYAEQYRRLWEEHWWWRSRERFVLRVLERLKLPREAQILDVGCGDGLFFPSLERLGTVDGLEADRSLLRDTGISTRIKVGRLDRSFNPGPIYDLVVMLDVLEHIEDDLESMESALDALKPDGKIVLTVPALEVLWSEHDVVNQHYRRYDKTRLKAVMAAAGFEVESVNFFFGWTVAPLLVRRLIHPAVKNFDAETSTDLVTIPPPLVNRAMQRLSEFDHWLGERVRWPIGSSLIAIGTRPGSAITSERSSTRRSLRSSIDQETRQRQHVGKEVG